MPVVYYETCAACGGQVRIEERPDEFGTILDQVCTGCHNYSRFHLDPQGAIEAHAWSRERNNK